MTTLHLTNAKPVAVYSPAAKDGADGVALDAPVNALLPTGSMPHVYVSAVLGTGAATVAVVVILYDRDQALIGVAPGGPQTATASAYSRAAAAANYYAPTLEFNAAGAAFYEVRSADPSAGTRELTTWAA